MSDNDSVLLQCIRVGTKLRVRVVSKGYIHDANCQFPTELRVEGATYTVPKNKIFLVGKGKRFYRVSARDVTLVTGGDETAEKIEMRIFEDPDDAECCTCMDANKNIVLAPCGHYCLCNTCANALVICPICRSRITERVPRSQVATL